ncbi:MAG: hypothetical protein ACHQSE_13430 [Gemmatimonadales bacterium]|jgi:hypothetical protein
MTNNTFRRITCLVAMLALGVASSLNVRPAVAATAGASATSPAAAAASAAVATPTAGQSGRGWGALIACAGCAIAGGLIVAGGPASILIAVNTPGSSIALLACVGSCYEALAK